MTLGRVLIVDDQVHVRQAVGLALSKAGYEITTQDQWWCV
jgi:DNA-binding NtrC family response regulator